MAQVEKSKKIKSAKITDAGGGGEGGGEKKKKAKNSK